MSFSVSYTFEAVDRFSGVARKLNQQISATTQKINRMGDAMRTAGEKLGRFGRSMTLKATAPIVAFGTLATMTFIDFEKSMNMVGAVAKASGKELDMLKQAAIDMGAKTQYSARQVAQAEVFLGLAGKHTSEIIALLPNVLQLAASAQLDMASAANIVLNVMAGYNFKADQLNRVNDVLVETFTNTKTNLEELGGAMKRVGPYASRLGVNFEEAAASLGLMAQRGFGGEIAGRLFAQAMIQMVRPSKKAQEIMKKGHIVFTDTHGKLLSLVKIIKELQHAGITGASYIELFGARAGPIMSGLVAQGSEALADLTKKLKASGGIAQRVATAQMQGLVGSFYKLRAALEHVRIVFIGQFEPSLIKITDKLRNWILSMANSNSETKKLIVGFLGVLAVSGPLAMGLSKVVFVILMMRKLGIAVGLIDALGISFKFLWRSILGPIGVILTLISVLVILYKKFKSVRDIVREIFSFFKEMLFPILKLIHAFEWLGKKIEQIHTAIKAGRGRYMDIPSHATRVSPIIEHAHPAAKVASTLDINVHDREKLIKSIAAHSAGEINVNLGQNMAASR